MQAILQLSLEDTPTVQHYVATVDVPASSRAKIHDRSGDILRQAESSIWACSCELLRTTSQLHQTARHLGGEKPRRNGIAQNVLRAELKSEVARQVEYSSFRCRVCECRVLPESPDANACYRGCGDDTGWVLLCAVFAKERCESARMSIHQVHQPDCSIHTSVHM
jgi:hypothetical protein